MADETKPCLCNIRDQMEYGGLGQGVQIEHFHAYVVKPTAVSLKAIIVIQDIFGWKLPNTRYIDMITSNRYIEMDSTIKFLKNKCGAKHIGIAGFCWGGIATHYAALRYPEIKAAISVYGAIYAMDDKFDFKSPTLFIFGAKDETIPFEQVKVLEDKLKEKCKVDYQVKIFPGQTHGFVHRKGKTLTQKMHPRSRRAGET